MLKLNRGRDQWWSQAPHRRLQTQKRDQRQPGDCSCSPVFNLGWVSAFPKSGWKGTGL
ncbi:hypothetical protein SLEP1_g23698 [Rubroshorea leprosula]|uniref:Uncharacterized protein n=1 Tax=Rubroshorea leprosula TaxID=152421 RepID=A0AAV5JMI0_9ROSI|nr:hypothetical protein SLEP1_g23698 [Rubroshorea leprosula]